MFLSAKYPTTGLLFMSTVFIYIYIYILKKIAMMSLGGARKVLDITRQMVTHARSKVEDVEFSAEDALRSDYDFLSEV